MDRGGEPHHHGHHRRARLLASGRAITIGAAFPVILLIASHGAHAQTNAADAAGYAAFGLTLTAWNTYGVRLVAAREAGVLKRWRATPLPRWCYFLGRIAATVVVAAVAGAATVAAAVLLYHIHLTVSGALGALVAFVLGAFAWAATASGHPLLPSRDLIVLAAWAVAGLAVAVATFRWEPQPGPPHDAQPEHHAQRDPPVRAPSQRTAAARPRPLVANR